MAGIYLHIPFCKTRCIYCDFYSTTLGGEWKSRYIDALCAELRMRKSYLQGEPVETIYFCGGTPSQLEEADFRQVFAAIGEVYGMEAAQEITLEANPDDLTDAYTEMLARLPFNRVSMGIQTFDDRMLRLLNRRHDAATAIRAVERLRQAGFRNISIDLIYGLPGETDRRWLYDLRQATALGVEHLSAYHLTYEEGTHLHQLLQAGQVHEVDEESSLRFFSTLMEQLQEAGYEHYEISNFCRPGKHSRHNTAYWQGVPYLGCGPSAHSYNRTSREWNVASLKEYLCAMESGNRLYETEELDTLTRYNEYLMTGLRTAQGISIERVETDFGKELKTYCLRMAAPYLASGKLTLQEQQLKLTREGIFTSDGIISELMRI